MIENIKKLKKGIIENKDSAFIEAIVLFMISFMQILLLDFSTYIKISPIKIGAAIGVTMIMVFINYLFGKIFKNLKIILIINTCIIFVLSLVSYIIFKYHGTPFLASDIHNIMTATNAMKGSNLLLMLLQARFLLLIPIFILTLFMCKYFKKKYSPGSKRFKIITITSLAITIFVICTPIVIPEDPVFFSFSCAVEQYTYPGCFIKQAILNANPIKMPDGYDENEVKEFLNTYNIEESGEKNYPDIILILNEAFFDANIFEGIKQSEDPLKDFYLIDNAIYGYTVVPGEGGGTNKSEYELLTSNSLSITTDITPFNTLDFENTSSIVSFLKENGYYTHANHPMEKDNYRRGIVYNYLGFDESKFKEDYENPKYFLKRDQQITDESVYENIEKWYEKMPDSPRFIFCVTMQNHAYYFYNNIEDLDVKMYTKDEKISREWSEWASCIRLSAEAFKSLTEYYKNSDRDVIIAMCGDHAPYNFSESFDLNNKEKFDLKIRSTPFVIWSNNEEIISNYKYRNNIEGKTRISTYNLMPLIIEMANIPRSPFYDYLIKSKDKIPVITMDGKYYDNNGNEYNIFGKDKKENNIVTMLQKIWYYNMKK